MKKSTQKSREWRFGQKHRKGVFFVLAVICLLGAMTFVGMSVDLGMITVTKTRMQAAADAAALAAAQEIVVAVRRASWDSESGLDMDEVQAAAATDSRAMAIQRLARVLVIRQASRSTRKAICLSPTAAITAFVALMPRPKTSRPLRATAHQAWAETMATQ